MVTVFLKENKRRNDFFDSLLTFKVSMRLPAKFLAYELSDLQRWKKEKSSDI